MKYTYENGKKQTLTSEYFLGEIHKFREIMCSKEYTLEQKEQAFIGLTYIWVAMSDIDPNGKEAQFYETTCREWEIRASYEVVQPISNAFDELMGVVEHLVDNLDKTESPE